MKTMKMKLTLCLGLAIVKAFSIAAGEQPAPQAENYSL